MNHGKSFVLHQSCNLCLHSFNYQLYALTRHYFCLLIYQRNYMPWCVNLRVSLAFWLSDHGLLSCRLLELQMRGHEVQKKSVEKAQSFPCLSIYRESQLCSKGERKAQRQQTGDLLRQLLLQVRSFLGPSFCFGWRGKHSQRWWREEVRKPSPPSPRNHQRWWAQSTGLKERWDKPWQICRPSCSGILNLLSLSHLEFFESWLPADTSKELQSWTGPNKLVQVKLQLMEGL